LLTKENEIVLVLSKHELVLFKVSFKIANKCVFFLFSPFPLFPAICQWIVSVLDYCVGGLQRSRATSFINTVIALIRHSRSSSKRFKKKRRFKIFAYIPICHLAFSP